MLSNSSTAQRVIGKDSVMLVTYQLTLSSPASKLKLTSTGSLIIDGMVSYYYTSDPNQVTDDGNKIPGTIKYADSNYALFNRPMMPKYDRFTYFSDTLHPMKWNLTGRTIVIKDRVGYEAKTFFRGRHFTAYYDPKIPLNNGPVKFGGLPGLIIKLFDSERIWDYELKTITKGPAEFQGNKINYAGNYKMFLSIYPEWRRRLEEKFNANESTDPNCPTCGSKSTYYSLEIYE